MILKKILASLFALFFLCTHAQERILNFNSKIQIEKSGNIQVIETITIKSEGNQFKRGLLRVLPLKRKDKNGDNIDVEYTINSVKKNGTNENYFTQMVGGDWKIYIGNEAIFLENGEYEYQISYTTPFQVGYFDTYDEMYWNVTGNGWDFPIDKASCQIYLPSENNTFQNVQCYTGLSGSKASDCISSLNENKSIASFSAVNLQEKEGLTVAASFPKGIIDPPTTAQKTISFYKQIKTNLWSIIFGIGMSIFFFVSWKKHGKDPTKKTIIPEFRPPFGWSPAVIGYVYKQDYKRKMYMASLINTAVKGAIKICSTLEKGIFTSSNLYEIEIKNKNANLSIEEASTFKKLCGNDKIKVDNSNYKEFNDAYYAWLIGLKNQINLEDFYQNNTRKKWIGFLIFVIAGLAFEMLVKETDDINFIFYIGLIVGASLITYWFSKKVNKTGHVIIRFILSFFILSSSIFIFFASLSFLQIVPIIVIGVVFLLYIFYVWNLGKYTEKGAEAIEKIEGFKLYLESAEKDRMNMLNPPELTPQLFEELFPYAVVLGVEIDWGKQFEKILELAKYNPEWYQGQDVFYRQPMFISSFNNTLSSSRIDPTPSSSSSSSSSSGSSGSWSSGSSGGGSSGGGGGGGGGGGW
jgi:uncharacterized membrane protein YgcG